MLKSERLNMYADTLADIFGVLFVLALGFLPFLYIADLFSNDKSWNTFYWIIPFAVGIPSLILLLKFHKKDESNEKVKEKNVFYVVDKWSIETLRAKDAPGDLIESLEEIHKKEIKSARATGADSLRPSYKRNEILEKLEKKLGKLRVKEIEELVLKYTQRENPKGNQEIRVDEPKTD